VGRVKYAPDTTIKVTATNVGLSLVGGVELMAKILSPFEEYDPKQIIETIRLKERPNKDGLLTKIYLQTFIGEDDQVYICEVVNTYGKTVYGDGTTQDTVEIDTEWKRHVEWLPTNVDWTLSWLGDVDVFHKDYVKFLKYWDQDDPYFNIWSCEKRKEEYYNQSAPTKYFGDTNAWE